MVTRPRKRRRRIEPLLESDSEPAQGPNPTFNFFSGSGPRCFHSSCTDRAYQTKPYGANRVATPQTKKNESCAKKDSPGTWNPPNRRYTFRNGHYKGETVMVLSRYTTFEFTHFLKSMIIKEPDYKIYWQTMRFPHSVANAGALKLS